MHECQFALILGCMYVGSWLCRFIDQPLGPTSTKILHCTRSQIRMPKCSCAELFLCRSKCLDSTYCWWYWVSKKSWLCSDLLIHCWKCHVVLIQHCYSHDAQVICFVALESMIHIHIASECVPCCIANALGFLSWSITYRSALKLEIKSHKQTYRHERHLNNAWSGMVALIPCCALYCISPPWIWDT